MPVKPPLDIVRRAGHIMDHWQDFAWTVQGFGMIRTYLDEAKQYRLNVWTPALRVPDVSEIHDHPWTFQSWIMCGRLTNTRFNVATPLTMPHSLPFQHVVIKTGEGGGPVGEVDSVYLNAMRPEVYEAGDTYTQQMSEIHITKTVPGTVTLNDRSAPTAAHEANIYWPRGPWVNAEPRPATQEEVFAAVRLAAQQMQILRMFG